MLAKFHKILYIITCKNKFRAYRRPNYVLQSIRPSVWHCLIRAWHSGT